MRFSCSCSPKLEGMCRVGEEDAEHPKCAHGEGQHKRRAGWGVCASAGWVGWGDTVIT